MSNIMKQAKDEYMAQITDYALSLVEAVEYFSCCYGMTADETIAEIVDMAQIIISDPL